jgi:hypothetical protein
MNESIEALETYVDSYPWLLIPLIIIGTIVWFLFVLFILSRLGWQSFADKYERLAPTDLTYIGISSATMGHISYNNCIILSSNSLGIYLKPMLLFSFRHKPLFIPFDQIKRIENKKSFGHQMVAIILQDDNIPKMKLQGKTWDKIIATSGYSSN